MKQRRELRRTTAISLVVTVFLIGLYFSKSIHIQIDFLFLVATAIFLIIFRKSIFLFMALAIIFGLSVGLWRGNITKDAISGYQTNFNKEVTAVGNVVDDPVYDNKGRLGFRIDSITLEGQAIAGQIRVKSYVSSIRRGDKIVAVGKLTEGFANYQASMHYANVAVVEHSSSLVEKARRKFFTAVYNVLPEPHASLGLGFLVGLRSALPSELDEQLRIVGLTHIVVASGFNLTILVRIARRLLARYSKYQAFAGSIILIFGFLMITGASPAIIRAAVVTILSLLAWFYGRRFQPVLVILLGAAVTAGYNPLFIWFDVGWWLSFLAFAGVLIIAPIVTKKLYRDKSPQMIVQVAVETISAQLVATPLILALFGKISMVALLANIMVVPIIPFAMLATFVAGMLGLLIPISLAAWIALPARIILGYIVTVTRFFALPSWAQRDLNIGWLSMIIIYGIIVVMVAIAYRRTHMSFEKIPSVVE